MDEIYILEDRGFIFVNGEDAKDFLQNIITKDINLLNCKRFCIDQCVFLPVLYIYFHTSM